MTRTITFDDSTAIGKAILAVVALDSKTQTLVKIRPSQAEQQAAYEDAFVAKMKEARNEGFLSEQEEKEFLEELGL